MAISLMSAYQLSVDRESPVAAGARVLNDSMPLEDLVDPALRAGEVWDLNLLNLGIGPGELRDFLLHDQHGPREIAKRIFRVVSAERMMSFEAALAEPVTVPGAPIFAVVPKDRGHYPGPYFTHFLRGLRMSPPEYVLDLLQGRPAPPELTSRLAGVVVVRI
jgi:hypothetical protein